MAVEVVAAEVVEVEERMPHIMWVELKRYRVECTRIEIKIQLVRD